MKNLFDKLASLIFGKEIGTSDKRLALGGSLGNAVLQFGSMALVFLLNVLIARIGGEEAYGAYSQVFNWLFVLWIAGAFGTGLLLVKEVPRLQEEGNGQGLRRILGWSIRASVFTSLAICFVFWALVNLGTIPGWSDNASYFNLAIIGIPLAALIIPLQAYLQGLKKVVWAATAEKIAKPVGLAIGIFFFWLLGKHLEPESYILANIFALGFACVYSLVLVMIANKSLGGKGTIPKEKNDWLRRCLWFTASGLLYVLSTRADVLFIGYAMENTDVGYYNAALKFSDLALIPSLMVSQSVTPLFASYFSAGRQEELKALYKRSTRFIFGLTLPMILVFFLVGRWMLQLYGDGFADAYLPFMLLCIAKLCLAFVGPVGYLMMMCGEEKSMVMGIGIQLLVTLGFLIFLVPEHGMLGASVSALVGVSVFVVFIAIMMKRKTGVGAFPF